MEDNKANNLGTIIIKPEAIAKYAGSVAVESFGIVGMAAVSMRDGLVKLLKRESLSRGVKVKVSDDSIAIDMHVIVVYGVNIPTVTQNLIENVTYQVEKFAGMPVSRMRVYIEGVRVND